MSSDRRIEVLDRLHATAQDHHRERGDCDCDQCILSGHLEGIDQAVFAAHEAMEAAVKVLGLFRVPEFEF